MTTNGRTAAVGATTTTVKELHVQGGSASDPTPPRVSLQPGPAGWWVLSVEGRPAVKFRDPVHAALTLRDVVDDLRDGFTFWKEHDDGRYTRVSGVYLNAVAEGNLPAVRLAGAPADSRAFTVCKGW